MLVLVIKRLLWMIPTMVIISFISFSIIQLPPGIISRRILLRWVKRGDGG